LAVMVFVPLPSQLRSAPGLLRARLSKTVAWFTFTRLMPRRGCWPPGLAPPRMSLDELADQSGSLVRVAR